MGKPLSSSNVSFPIKKQDNPSTTNPKIAENDYASHQHQKGTSTYPTQIVSYPTITENTYIYNTNDTCTKCWKDHID